MTISLSPSELAWVNLPTEQKDMFNSIAYKDGNPDLDGYDWFDHLVPDALKDNPQEVEVFMNGGTVTQEVWVHDQGVGNGHYETVDHTIADKDVSRIQSGDNGGDYSLDNTVMEDASMNRARGAENMTGDELESIEAANAAEVQLIDGGQIVTDASEPIATAAEGFESVADSLLDGLIPITYGIKAGHAVWEANSHMTTEDRVATTALASGLTVATTYTLCLIPGVNLVMGGIALYKLGEAGYKMLEKA